MTGRKPAGENEKERISERVSAFIISEWAFHMKLMNPLDDGCFGSNLLEFEYMYSFSSG